MESASPPELGAEIGPPPPMTSDRQRRQSRGLQEFRYVLGNLVVAVFGPLYVLAVLFVGVGLAVVLAGIPLLALGLAGARRWGAVEARRARLLDVWLDRTPPPPVRPGLGGWTIAHLTDASAWRVMLYLVAKLPTASTAFVTATAFYGLGAVLATYPVWFRMGASVADEEGVVKPETTLRFDSFYFDTWLSALALGLAGVLMLILAPRAIHISLAPDRLLSWILLRPGRGAERIRDLEDMRARTLDDATSALRRIERDLHDGAQARLVTLAMDLGLIKQTLEDDDSGQNKQQIRDLIEIAHSNAKEALTELRNLARGFHPPILDSGLDAALASLTNSVKVPVDLSIDLYDRPSPAIEAISYFCVAELLTNVVKHSDATRTSVRVSQRHDMIRLEVQDDGRGGARIGAGSGLTGLAERLRRVDGRITVNSPVGGPTIIRAHLPLRA
ncbi:sensor histidine kinase [Micromonospora siamensis]|uniref:histidine kinase n=1 Tax=Micromonospora siamensis TaxID=299152 RepID=A0A1C5HF52_9ACTN|nr:sensor histidine kinase [Micromonospora siamensis]SCG44487.1 Signal transduction histidine kinase [Micromonospora siamensis]